MSSLEQMYQQVILDHARERHGCGNPTELSASSHQVNPTCGDETTLGVTLSDSGVIESLAWDGDGCSISQASLSMLSDMVAGADLARVRELYSAMETMMHSRGQGVDEDTLEGTSQFPNRVKCALLGWYALRDALAQLGTDIAGENE